MDTGAGFMSGIDLNTVNGYIALAAVLINFTFALLALVRTSRETVYVTFALVCMGVAWWNFFDFMVFASGSSIWKPVGIGATTQWKNFVSIGSGLAVAALFHFTMALVGRLRAARLLIILAYALAIPLGMMPSGALFSEAINRFWVGPGWNLSFFTLLFPFMAASIIIITNAYRRSRDVEERGWLIFILLAMIIQVAAGMTDLFHKMAPSLPPLGHLGSAIGPTVLAVGVYRYRKTFDVLAQAQRKLELLSETAAQIAHEVRSPLTAIKGLIRLQTAAPGELDQEKVGQYQGILTEEVGRIENILNNLQDLTKPLIAEMEITDVNSVLTKTVQLAELRGAGLDVKLDLEEDLPRIEADGSLLKQVFMNLIHNASEACGDKGNLQVRTSSDRHQLQIQFTDDGPGVPEEIRSRLFEPFFTTKESGLGLGLVIIGRIIENHKGKVHVENNDPTGARVTISLPR